MVTQEGENVGVCSVVGNFDDAQTGVKQLFSDEALRAGAGRAGGTSSPPPTPSTGAGCCPRSSTISPPTATCCGTRRSSLGEPVNVCVPTGNFGNILAAYYAKQMGVPDPEADLRLQQQQRAHRLPAHRRVRPQPRRSTTPCRPPWTSSSPATWSGCSSELTDSDDEEVRGYMAQLAATGRYEVSDEVKEKLQKRVCRRLLRRRGDPEGHRPGCGTEVRLPHRPPHRRGLRRPGAVPRARRGTRPPAWWSPPPAPSSSATASCSALGEDGAGRTGMEHAGSS